MKNERDVSGKGFQWFKKHWFRAMTEWNLSFISF